MSSTPWWRDRRKRDRVAVYVFAVLGVGGILVGATYQYAEGDQRVMVVTMERDPSDSLAELAERRERVKQACGDLPRVTVVPDRGDPAVQGRFPVRFSIRGATNRERDALEACLDTQTGIVRGYRVEGGP